MLLRFTANVYWRRRHSNFALPPSSLTSGVVHSELEVRTIVPQSIVPCSIAWTDRQTKMMGVSELCNRQPLRLEYETPRHGVHMQIANEGVEGRRRMTLPYWQSCQVLQYLMLLSLSSQIGGLGLERHPLKFPSSSPDQFIIKGRRCVAGPLTANEGSFVCERHASTASAPQQPAAHARSRPSISIPAVCTRLSPTMRP